MKSVCIIIKITLYKNNGGSLVSGSACQITERTYKIGNLSRSSPLRSHISDKICFLCLNAFGYGSFQCVPAEILEVVISKIFELKLVRSADKTIGISGRYTGIGKLPYFPLRILKGARRRRP